MALSLFACATIHKGGDRNPASIGRFTGEESVAPIPISRQAIAFPFYPYFSGQNTNVTTYHNDLARTGQNLTETILTRANVNSADFGKVASLPVDGQVYAEPLVMANIRGSRIPNLVFIATEHDSVYAYNTDSLSQTPVWHRSFLGDSQFPCPHSPCSTASVDDVTAPNVAPEIGITSTPVIDSASGTIYVVAFTKENGHFYWRLHALSVINGAEKPGSPVLITGALPGVGAGSVGGIITFKPSRQLSRSGLVLNNGQVMFGFSSFNDQEDCHGWMFSYNANTLAQTGTWMSTPHSGVGTIWMSGAAPAVDSSGSLYMGLANADQAAITTTDANDYGDAIVKLNYTVGHFSLSDWFMPYNHVDLDNNDVDLGSGGVLLLPDQPGAYPHLLVTGGKEGVLYLLNRDSLGHVNTAANANSDPQVVQEVRNYFPGGTADGPGFYGAPAYYAQKLFFVDAGDYLRSVPLFNGRFDMAASTRGTIRNHVRGASPFISANGTSNGIVWYADAGAYTYTLSNMDQNVPITLSNGPTVLYAYSTDDLSAPLYASNMVSNDAAGNVVKFSTPTVANGLVFVGTSTEVSVYGQRTRITSQQKCKDEVALLENGQINFTKDCPQNYYWQWTVNNYVLNSTNYNGKAITLPGSGLTQTPTKPNGASNGMDAILNASKVPFAYYCKAPVANALYFGGAIQNYSGYIDTCAEEQAMRPQECIVVGDGDTVGCNTCGNGVSYVHYGSEVSTMSGNLTNDNGGQSFSVNNYTGTMNTSVYQDNHHYGNSGAWQGSWVRALNLTLTANMQCNYLVPCVVTPDGTNCLYGLNPPPPPVPVSNTNQASPN